MQEIKDLLDYGTIFWFSMLQDICISEFWMQWSKFLHTETTGAFDRVGTHSQQALTNNESEVLTTASSCQIMIDKLVQFL